MAKEVDERAIAGLMSVLTKPLMVPGLAGRGGASNVDFAGLAAVLVRVAQMQTSEPRRAPANVLDPMDSLTTSDEPAAGVEMPAGAPTEASATDPRAFFERHERQLKDQAAITDKVLDRLQPALPDLPSGAFGQMPQQTITILCPASGSSGGRFVMRNATDTPRTVNFLARRGLGVDEEVWRACAVGFAPATVDLQVGDTAQVEVTIDLASAAIAESFEFSVDATSDDVSLLRLWVNVDVVA